ncbi:uncharacterized protein LOC133888863 [Phragmites australis]|uniref:uncharacterized protein LOC133888863 n=1 Tax=Phragmites australis TaxID=29695 RepID=UPI002D7998AC|nr:uncharacterized protein LOC133888863 [Phragmites australis]
MAEAGTAPPQTRLARTRSDVSARLQQVLALLFPSNLAAKAALFAVVVALLSLLPSSQAPRIWELPHLLLLGIIISYGVFGQKNADAEVAASVAAKPVVDESSAEAYVSQIMQGSLVFEDNTVDGDGDGGGAKDGGIQAWNSRYLPDYPLVVVAEAGGNNGKGDASEEPLLLPVRKLKPAPEESPPLTGYISDGIEEEEVFLAPKAGYNGVREHAIPSPSSVLDADLTLSPSSPPPPPPPPPFLGRGCSLRKAKARSFNEFGVGNRSMNGRFGLRSMSNKQLQSKSAVQSTRSTFASYDPAVPVDDEADGGELDEMLAASDSSFSSDMVTDDDDDKVHKEENSYEEEEEDGNTCYEELFELATRPGAEAEEETEDEVDRKADEFIAKFREQIRMQKVEPAR